MTLTLHVPESRDLKPRLTVFGVGGAGGNAVNNMIARSLEGVEFVVANTDAQSLTLSEASNKLQLGEELTEGLGAGAKPEVGARAAEESLDKITDFLMGSHMCFITAGMGGGTGTGAAPIIAQAARQMGILTVGVVTKPFLFEGSRRMTQAEAGIEELQQYVDTLIVIPNQNLFRVANEKTTFTEAFGMADDVLYQGVKGVTDLMVRPGLVNLDFADIRSVMDEMGKAMMGTGEADGEERATVAAERAIANPLLDEISLQGAKGVLINITGGDDMTLHEVDEASNKIRNEVDPDANIIFGSTYDPDMTGLIRVSVVATGIDAEQSARAPSRTSTRNVEAAPKAPADPDLFDQVAEQPVAQPTASVEPQGVVIADEQIQMDEAPSVNPGYDAAPVEQLDLGTSEAYVEAAAPIPEPMPAPQAQPSQVNEAADDMFANYETTTPQTPTPPPAPQADAEAEVVLKRMQKAAQSEPATAPAAPVQPAKGSRFSIDSMIRRMSGGDEERVEKPVASRGEPARELPARRVEPTPAARPAMDAGETERVDIPAFLRRKAN